MKERYTLSPRPNLYFDGDECVVDWFMDGIKGRWVGPQALLIRDNGTPANAPVTKLKAEEFINTVGVYNYRATSDEVMEALTFFWLRTIGERPQWKLQKGET